MSAKNPTPEERALDIAFVRYINWKGEESDRIVAELAKEECRSKDAHPCGNCLPCRSHKVVRPYEPKEWMK